MNRRPTFHFGSRSNTAPTTRAGKIGTTAFLSVFFLIGAGFFLVFGYFIVSELLVYRWSATPAVIETSEIEEDREEQDPYRFHVTYTYEVDGVTYTSDQFEREQDRTSAHGEVAQLVERYPAGSQVTCYVNPGDPTEAVLQRPPLGKHAIMALFLIIPLIFMTVGASGIWLTWRSRSDAEQDDAAVSLGTTPAGSGRLKRFGPVAFFTIFLLFGSIFPTLFFIIPFYRAQQAQDWPPVEATVLSSSVRSHSSSEGGTSYSIDIEFEYEFDGETYRSNRYNFSTGSSSGRASKQAVVNEHPPGSTTTAYVNPDDPHQAVINREFGGSMWLGLISFIFPLVGLGGLIGLAISRGKTAGEATTTPLTHEGARRRLTLPGADQPAHATDAGPVTLKPKESRWGPVIGLFTFALIWNAVIYGFISRAGFNIFVGIAALIGAASVIGAIYQTLRLFNPTVNMQLSSGRIHLGDLLRLDWRLEGSAHRVKHLTVTLKGTEEATYQAGTRTHTDTDTFVEFPLGEFDNAAEVQRASAELHVPDRAMHTFKADSNRVLWTIHVHGDIRFWPDLNQSFEVHILPREPAHV